MKNSLLLFLVLFYSFFSVSKWATPEDAGISYTFYNKSIKIKADGTYREKVHIKMKILNESGREELTSFKIFYNTASGKTSLIKATTTLKGVTHLVLKKNIEDKAIASSSQGFDEIRQILISFPRAEIGAEMEILYENIIDTPILTNFYSQILFFGIQGVWQESNIDVESELPLYLEINDPWQALTMTTKNKQEDLYKKFQIKLNKKNFIVSTLHEPEESALSDKKLTWVAFSSKKDWLSYAREMAPAYEKVRSQPLPLFLENILKAAKLIKN